MKAHQADTDSLVTYTPPPGVKTRTDEPSATKPHRNPDGLGGWNKDATTVKIPLLEPMATDIHCYIRMYAQSVTIGV